MSHAVRMRQLNERVEARESRLGLREVPRFVMGRRTTRTRRRDDHAHRPSISDSRSQTEGACVPCIAIRCACARARIYVGMGQKEEKVKLIARTFAVVGFLVFLFTTSGAIGIGHFRLYYGDSPAICEPTHANK